MLLNFIFGSPKVASSNGNGDLSAKILQREKSGLAIVTGTIELIDDCQCYMHKNYCINTPVRLFETNKK